MLFIFDFAGSMNMSYDSSNLTTPDIKWLGVRPSDLDRFSIPQQCRLPMTEEDVKTGRKLVSTNIKVPLELNQCYYEKKPTHITTIYWGLSIVSSLQLEEDFVKSNPEWIKELEIMVTTKVKAEIQALSSFGFQYLSQTYLPLKLQEGDWIWDFISYCIKKL